VVVEPRSYIVDKILFVDDDPSVLDAIQRAFHKTFEIHVADSAKEGLSIIQKNSTFPVIVSDFRMPGCDGVTFLSQVGKISPNSIRMMLTGCAQLETSIRAVNEGHIFRFITKPCPMHVLEKALRDGLHQYYLIQTEHEYFALRKWNESLGGLIQTFARLIESKDPYTAGHQLRVSQLSVAIAQAMGFSEDAVEQIRMAAVIHDIGKIYIPVEFLNKTGRLSSSEWNIVKMHAQIGHDILCPIGFPFPIHEIVLQHHERMDGSGYPMGLKESEICMEARIIAVADVVEAILHHRPYRPARGLEEAINEVRINRGTKYCGKIADAALVLLTEKQFQFG
jgi:putative two-component system response regulator